VSVELYLDDEDELWALFSFECPSSPTKLYDGRCKKCHYHTGKASKTEALESLTRHLMAKNWHEGAA
jgi:hypothetical protein